MFFMFYAEGTKTLFPNLNVMINDCGTVKRKYSQQSKIRNWRHKLSAFLLSSSVKPWFHNRPSMLRMFYAEGHQNTFPNSNVMINDCGTVTGKYSQQSKTRNWRHKLSAFPLSSSLNPCFRNRASMLRMFFCVCFFFCRSTCEAMKFPRIQRRNRNRSAKESDCRIHLRRLEWVSVVISAINLLCGVGVRAAHATIARTTHVC